MLQAEYEALNEQRRVSRSPAMPRSADAATISLATDADQYARARSAAISTASARFQLDPELERSAGRCGSPPTAPSCAATTSRSDDRLRTHGQRRADRPRTAISRSPAGRCRRCGSATARACSRSRCPRSIIAAASTRPARRARHAAAQHARRSRAPTGQDTQRAFASARVGSAHASPPGARK